MRQRLDSFGPIVPENFPLRFRLSNGSLEWPGLSAPGIRRVGKKLSWTPTEIPGTAAEALPRM